MLQTLKLNNKKKTEKSSFYEEKSLVGLPSGVDFINVLQVAFETIDLC
jgi:hypothetical protein